MILPSVPGRRATIRVLIIALLMAAVFWCFGADIWRSLVLSGLLTTVVMVWMAAAAKLELGKIDWRSVARPSREGARSEVAELSWSLRTKNGGVGHRAVWRVQELARHRLARYQLDLSEPADAGRIEQLVGHRAYAVLVPRERRPPSLESLLHCLDMLDALEPTGRVALAPKPPRRALNFSPRRISRLRRDRER